MTNTTTATAQGAASAVQDEPQTPSHLVELPGGQWALWRNAALRGTGFPAQDVLKLSAPECALAAELLFEAETEARNARTRALTALWDDLANADADARPALEKAIRRLQKGKTAQATGAWSASSPSAQAVEAYTAATAEVEAGRVRFRAAFESAMNDLARPVREVASSKRFREAVIWQNRHAYQNALEPILRKSADDTSRGSKQRQHEELIANYLQRYCVKNDTIGFFGPVGWAKFVTEGEAVKATPGDDLLAERNVRFETWCIDALADRLIKADAFTPWVVPRRVPLIRQDGNTLQLPFQPPVKISDEHATVLRACDGVRLAKDIAGELINTPGIRLKREEDVYKFLHALRQKGLISWSFSVPVPFKLNVEQNLRELCERVDDEELRRPVLDALGELEKGRRAVQDAAGDPDALNQALSGLEERFTQLTGMDSKRSAGQMYAARTLVYEDCRRDIEVEFGPEFIGALGPALSLLLTSARWFTYEVAALYRQRFDEIFDEYVSRNGASVVDAISIWSKARDIVLDINACLAHQVVPVLQERWAEIFNVEEGARRVEFTSAELKERVASAFDAPKAGWKLARYNSPDVMIAASSPEAIRRGDFQLVLGEMHMAGLTVANWIFLAQHPNPQELIESLERDNPDPMVYPIIPKHNPGVTARTTIALTTEKDYFLEYSLEPTDVPPARSLPISELVVERLDGELIVRTRDGKLKWDVINFLGGGLSGAVMNFMKIMRPAAHTPRVTIDKLVVCRESWAFTPAEISFAGEKDEAERFLAARRWAREHGLPRFVFVKSPVEVKPFFVDFDSPTFVNIFARLTRRTAAELNLTDAPSNTRIMVSEMIPSPDETWLPDAEGQRYTSELRIVSVDLNE